MHNLELSKLNSPQSEALTEQETSLVSGGFSLGLGLDFGSEEVDGSTNIDDSSTVQGSLNDNVDNTGGLVTGNITTDPGVVNF